MSLSKHYFCIAGNSRLTFEDASTIVESFVAAQLSQVSASYEFCADWRALEARVQLRHI